MPRTGTTALSHLLAADPDNRSLLAWEANESIPPPTTATYQSDPRFVAARAAVSPVDLINPGFKAIHHDEPDDAMECTVLHAQHFQSLIYSTTFNVPSYDEWLLSSDWRGAVGYHRLVLQVLQSECPGRWQLKSPQYGLLLDAVLDDVSRRAARGHAPRSGEDRGVDVQPAAFAHRHVQRRRPHRVHRRALAHDARRRCSTARWTPATASVRTSFFDVAYADVVRDPVAVVGTIYERFGIEWNPEKEAYLRRFHAANPQHQYGTHTYSLAEVGVERAPLEPRFARYYERYDVPREDA